MQTIKGALVTLSIARAEVCSSPSFPRVLGSSDGATSATCIAQDTGSNYYIGGTTASANLHGLAGTKVYAAKYSSAMDFEWGMSLEGDTQAFTTITTCIGDASTGDIWFLSHGILSFVLYDVASGTFSAAYVSDGAAVTSLSSVTDLQIQASNLFLLLQTADLSDLVVASVSPALSFNYVKSMIMASATSNIAGTLYASGGKLYIQSLHLVGGVYRSYFSNWYRDNADLAWNVFEVSDYNFVANSFDHASQGFSVGNNYLTG